MIKIVSADNPYIYWAAATDENTSLKYEDSYAGEGTNSPDRDVDETISETSYGNELNDLSTGTDQPACERVFEKMSTLRQFLSDC